MESKEAKSARMTPQKTSIAIITMLCASLAFADDFKTINDKEYKNVTVGRVEPDGLVLRSKSGVLKVYFSELPKEVVDKWLPPEDKERIAAKRAAEEKRIEAQNAADRERAEKEKNAEAALKVAAQQLQTAEERAAQRYQSAPKGKLAGQIFVSTIVGQSFKLGAVPVGLFDRKAIDAFIAAEKIYADIKIQQLRPSVDAALSVEEQAEATREYWFQSKLHSDYNDPNRETVRQSYDQADQAAGRARDEYRKMRASRDFYYSGAFYFGLLVNAIQTAETDADGKFAIQVPQTGTFVIAAQAKRSVGNEVEYYYWLQPVSLDGQQQLTQNLSNNNLTNATGTSSLIKTQD